METQYRQYITFKDPNVAKICIDTWSSDGKGLTYSDAAKPNGFGSPSVFRLKASLLYFDEFRFFTNVKTLQSQAFYNCTGMLSITTPPTLISLAGSCFRNTGGPSSGGHLVITFLCDQVMGVSSTALTNVNTNPFYGAYTRVQNIRVPADLVQSYKDHWFWGAVLADKIIAIE